MTKSTMYMHTNMNMHTIMLHVKTTNENCRTCNFINTTAHVINTMVQCGATMKWYIVVSLYNGVMIQRYKTRTIKARTLKTITEQRNSQQR